MKFVDNYWANEPAFLIGGGPSLKAFDFSLLRDVPHVIAVNAAFVDCPTAEVFVTEDARVIERFAGTPEWKAFAGVKLFACPDDAYVAQIRAVAPEVEIVHTRPKSKGWSKSLAEGLSTSSNSMIPALNLADVLGANPICLLGVDCGSDPKNYHARYPASWAMGTGQLESFRSDFTHWAAPNLRHRRVVNLNRASAVDCWPKTDSSYEVAVLRAAVTVAMKA